MAEEATKHIRDTAISSELILLKGSVDLHLERIALSFSIKIECWIPACGKSLGCFDCGRYGAPFDWPKGQSKRPRIRQERIQVPRQLGKGMQVTRK